MNVRSLFFVFVLPMRKRSSESKVNCGRPENISVSGVYLQGYLVHGDQAGIAQYKAFDVFYQVHVICTGLITMISDCRTIRSWLDVAQL